MAQEDLRRGNPEHAFTSTNQPSREAKSKGAIKRHTLAGIAKIILIGDAVDAMKPLARLLGFDEDKIDIEMMMHLKQIEKAIQESDTKAYNAVFDRLKGRPRQEIDLNNNISMAESKEILAKRFPEIDEIAGE